MRNLYQLILRRRGQTVNIVNVDINTQLDLIIHEVQHLAVLKDEIENHKTKAK